MQNRYAGAQENTGCKCNTHPADVGERNPLLGTDEVEAAAVLG